ncbi:unnamed protein product [Auanema sp. JU1783]|nr:unnamed protein product [Auanema sp. JU1783]
MDNSQVRNISGRALLFNILLLYGFGAIAQFVPPLFGIFRRGFFCDDDSIRYPYKKDTVSSGFLICYAIFVNALAIVFVEFYRMNRVENEIDQPQYKWKNSTIHALFVRFMTYFGYSQIGFICNITLTNIAKIVIGRLRPHFLDVCKAGNNTCTSSEHIFISNYTCTGDPSLEMEGRKSFFSGHSSISMYASVWTALYLQARLLSVCGNRIIIPIIQTIVVAAGMGISLSRINDNMHHWSDVLVGMFVGSFIATYTCICWTNMFHSKNNNHSVLPTEQVRYGATSTSEATLTSEECL